MANRISPFIKRLRTNGGTIYTFSSALEDIGLNINERNNIVKISDFALLNIPSIDEPSSIDQNRFNVRAINGVLGYEQSSSSIKDGRILIAESFQNYALNLESNLLNRSDYNATLSSTVSERVFWKWLKETGAIRWVKDASGYFTEEIDVDASLGYDSVIKYIGQVSAGNVRTDSFGTYNETYILIPTSHGQTKVYFKQVEDDNYKHNLEIGDLGENILGRESYTQPHPDALSFNAFYDFVDSSTQVGSVPYYTYYDASTGSYSEGWWYTGEGIEPSSTDNAYLTDSSVYLTSGIYNTNLKYDDGGGYSFEFKRSNIDCMSIQFDLNTLKTIYSDSNLTYDKIAIDYAINDSFNFNAVLIYYSIYNSTLDTLIAKNLLGVLFLDAPSGNSSNIGFGGILLPSLEKIQSSASGYGTSYSLRLNIKTDNMFDDTQATIIDESTSSQTVMEDLTDIFYQLQKSVNILGQHTSTINTISEQYISVSNNQTQIINSVNNLGEQVNDISRDIAGEENTIAMFATGDDPLVESSIYMSSGKIGFGITNPEYFVHIDGNTKVDDLTIENSIRDTSGNILLSYGSPLQIGASTNYRGLNFYNGNTNPVISIDMSSNINIIGDVSISGNNFTIDSSIVNNTGSIPININGTDMFLFDSSGTQGYFYASGNIISFSSVFSDKRLKDNIEPLNSSLDKVLLTQGISYNLKTNNEKHIGYIAQDIEQIIPEIVSETKKLDEPGILYKAINYQEMIPYLSESIKQLNKTINKIQDDVNIIKQKLNL